ncbi:MAG: hypothetical protein JSU65_12950 [Candidatus Zixiibacteriota bacterium]|nr:MAG: hypothetical protein JSU65_12950 [candidate division Zixibacteria bacterium]
MPELKFNKGTDTEHEVELESHLISASWTPGCAFAGHAARFEVNTALVGAGAKIKVTGKSEKGEKLGKVSGEIRNNTFVDEFDVPEDMEPGDRIYFEVELPDNSLDGESNHIPVFPPPRIKSIGWSATEARRGDILTLSAEVENIRDETEVKLVIYEYDQDGAHDRITELLAKVMNARVELEWEYEYHEDTDEIPTEEERQKYGASYNPPEYFFTIKIEDLELGREQESGILKFKDWFEIRLADDIGEPVPDEKYVLYLPDGSKREGTLDSNGYAREENIPPGTISVEFPDIERVQSAQEEKQ